uniref:Uncharacterized protein n=1 Tax=Oryza punctata TaxID=4537 RepID=A0A0E0KTE3_ORYPU
MSTVVSGCQRPDPAGGAPPGPAAIKQSRRCDIPLRCSRASTPLHRASLIGERFKGQRRMTRPLCGDKDLGGDVDGGSTSFPVQSFSDSDQVDRKASDVEDVTLSS